MLWAKGDASFAIDYPVAILLFLSTIMSSIQFVGLEILRAKGMHDVPGLGLIRRRQASTWC